MPNNDDLVQIWFRSKNSFRYLATLHTLTTDEGDRLILLDPDTRAELRALLEDDTANDESDSGVS
jgi:hypothetical protein